MDNFIKEYFVNNDFCYIVFENNQVVDTVCNNSVSSIDEYINMIDDEYKQTIKDVLAKDTHTTIEYKVLQDKAVCWLKSYIVVDTNIKKVTILSQNITHTKDIEAKVTNLNSYMNNTADLLKAINNSAIVSITDKDGNIEYANDKFFEISKYTQDEVIGNTHDVTKHPKNTKTVYTEIFDTVSKKQIWQGVIKNRSKDGKTYYLDTTITPIFDDKSTITKYILIKYDVTKEKVLEKEKKKRLIKLKTSSLLSIQNKEKKFNSKIIELENSLQLLLSDKRVFNHKIDALNNEIATKNMQITRLLDETRRLENTLKTFVKKQKIVNPPSKFKKKTPEENVLHETIAKTSGVEPIKE